MTAQTYTMKIDDSRRSISTYIVIILTLCKLLDAACIIGGGVVAWHFFGVVSSGAGTIGRLELPLVVATAAAFILILQETAGYTAKSLSSSWSQIAKVAPLLGGELGLISSILFIFDINNIYSLRLIVAWGATSLTLILGARAALGLLLIHWRKLGILQRKIVVVGAGETGTRVISYLVGAPDTYHILGIFDDRQSRVPREVYGVPVLGSVRDLLIFARQQLPDEIIVTLPLSNSERIRTGLKALTVLPVDLRLTCETVAPGFKLRNVSYIGTIPVIDIFQRPLRDWNFIYKWLEDKILSLLAMIVLSPVIVACAVLIKLDSPGPILFRQERFGYNNKIITVLKFRTMYMDLGDESGARRTIRGDSRVTRVGRVLRAFSLDELPQLWNVLRGDMSLVGPRAHAVAMRVGEKLYGDTVEEYFARHRVPPGLTGLAQVNGLRGEITDVEAARTRLHYDLDYIDRWSIWLDLRIILRSVWVVLFERDNAY